MSKASIDTHSRDYYSGHNSDAEKNSEIVFSNKDALNKYNEKLLDEFIIYLNTKHKESHNVFNCGATVQVIQKEKLVKEFIDMLSFSCEGKYI